MQGTDLNFAKLIIPLKLCFNLWESGRVMSAMVKFLQPQISASLRLVTYQKAANSCLP